jgi:hypothetical protein
MKSLSRVLQPLHKAARAFFSHDVAIERDADGVRLVLQEALPPGVPRPPTRRELAQKKERDELTLVQDQLRDVLDEATGARTTLHHLVFVEHAINKKGLRALHKLPLPVLRRALEQLEHLVTNWSPEGLANLRSKMAVAIIDREHMDPQAEAEAYRTAAVLDLPVAPGEERVVDLDLDLSRPAPSPQTAEDEAAALAAAYAAIGAATSTEPMSLEPLEYHEELGSAGARAKARTAFRDTGALPEIQLRELQP